MEFHYRVLYTRTDKQNEVCALLGEALPKGRGRVFIPRFEYYRRDRKEIDVKPLFPGYIFFHTDLTRLEIHQLVKEQRPGIRAFIRELGYQNDLMNSKGKGPEVGSGEESLEVWDVDGEEADFLDRMLDEKGVERMSWGYLDPKIVVVEGPLLAYQDRIISRDLHNRLVWLDLTFRKSRIAAGFIARPKEEYASLRETEEKLASSKGNAIGVGKQGLALLGDGSRVDIDGIKRKMNG